MQVEIRGDRTGRTWSYHITRDVVGGVRGSGPRHRATASDDGTLAWVHSLEKGSLWDDDIARLRQAIRVASRPEVAAARTIRRLLDMRETEGESGEFGFPGSLVAIWEWADVSLHDWLQAADDPSDAGDEIEKNVRNALEVLHGIGLVHLDVAPNSILRVDGRWKLGDLHLCTEAGAPISDRQPPPLYRHPDRVAGTPAREEFDLFGLEQALESLPRTR